MGADWRQLTYWEYSARLAKWNEAHDDGSAPLEPDYDVLRRMMN